VSNSSQYVAISAIRSVRSDSRHQAPIPARRLACCYLGNQLGTRRQGHLPDFMNTGSGADEVALNTKFDSELRAAIEKLKEERVYKRLNYLASPQDARVQMEGRGEVVILSSNNYLGLCNDPEVVAAGLSGLKKFGAGTGRVRFSCVTFTVHRELEQSFA